MNKLTTAEFDMATAVPVVSDADRALHAAIVALAEEQDTVRLAACAARFLRRSLAAKLGWETRRANRAYSSGRDCCGGGRQRWLSNF